MRSAPCSFVVHPGAGELDLDLASLVLHLSFEVGDDIVLHPLRGGSVFPAGDRVGEDRERDGPVSCVSLVVTSSRRARSGSDQQRDQGGELASKRTLRSDEPI